MAKERLKFLYVPVSLSTLTSAAGVLKMGAKGIEESEAVPIIVPEAEVRFERTKWSMKRRGSRRGEPRARPGGALSMACGQTPTPAGGRPGGTTPGGRTRPVEKAV